MNPSSHDAIKSRFNKLCKDFEGQEFNRQTFTIYIAHMKEGGAAASHVNKTIGVAKHLDKFLKLNNLQDFTYFRESGLKNRDILTPQEIEQLAGAQLPYARYHEMVNLRQKALILFLGTTGCRIGEALGLKVENVFSNPLHVIFKNTKNGDDRHVPIYKELYEMMMRVKGEENVFVSYRGGKLTEAQVNLDLKKRASLCGMTKPVYNHLFRHSYITTMLMNKVPWMDLAPLVGHKDPKTTMRYSHFDLGHYTKIALQHPILRKNLTPLEILDQIKEAIMSCPVNDKRFKYEITDKGYELVFRIEFLGDNIDF